MNVVSLTGRFTKDPLITKNGEMAIARFTLAVNRRSKRDGEPEADFISCVCFNKTAEFVERYFFKGMKADVQGRLQTGSYINKDGVKVYTTDVIIENIEFGESKGSRFGASESNNALPPAPPAQQNYTAQPPGMPPVPPTNQTQYQAPQQPYQYQQTPPQQPGYNQYGQYPQQGYQNQVPQQSYQQPQFNVNVPAGTDEEVPFN